MREGGDSARRSSAFIRLRPAGSARGSRFGGDSE
jgi:hypothetical protein